MEIIADLFGWGMVGLTVAAPLVSLLTDLEARVDRGAHPSPGHKAGAWPPGDTCAPSRAAGTNPGGQLRQTCTCHGSAGLRGDGRVSTHPGTPESPGCCRRRRVRVDTGGSEESACSCVSADSRLSTGSEASDDPVGSGANAATQNAAVAGTMQAATQAAGDSPHSEAGGCHAQQGSSHPPRHDHAPVGSRQPRPALLRPMPRARGGFGTGWGNIITPPPQRAYPRRGQAGAHGEASAWGADVACSKAWNSSSHRAFSAHGALVSSYTMSECQGPHPYWEDRHIVFHQPGRIVFGVFDGHGRNGQGKAASEFCSEYVQTHLLGLSRSHTRPQTASAGAASGAAKGELPAAGARAAPAGSGATCQRATPDAQSPTPDAPEVAEVDGLGSSASCRSDNMRSAFLLADEAFRQQHPAVAYDAGTTALVVAVGRASLCIANAGDCRAVLSRCGRAVNLSTDHKPSLPAEFSRIQAAGGRIVRPDPRGPLRVCSPDGRTGLAVSRGLGDHAFKDPGSCPRPLLDPTPEVREVALCRGDDELLILASDGLWDVISSQQAVDMARAAPARLASDLLVREAIACGSQDNVTVVVIRLYS